MAVATYQPPADRCQTTLVIAGGDPIQVPLLEISAVGGVVDYSGEVKRHEYVDVTFAVEGAETLSLFAHVVNIEAGKVRLRWLHFDPGDEGALDRKLAERLGAVDGVTVEQRTKSHFAWRQGTKHITRPSTDSGDKSDAEVGQSSKPKTRRVVRPQAAPPAQPSGSEALARKGSGESSKLPPQAPKAPAGAESDDDEYAAQEMKSGPASATSAGGTTGNWRERQGAEGQPAGDPPTGIGSGSKGHIAIVGTARFDSLKAQEAKNRAQGKAQGKEPAAPAAEAGGTGRFSEKAAVTRSILARTREVQASELAARHDKVRVLNMSTIRGLISEAVTDTVADLKASGGDVDQDKLQKEVEARVKERLKEFQSEKKDMAAQAEKLEKELKEAKAALEKERLRAIEANRFVMSESGMVDLQQRMERLVQRAIKLHGVDDSLAEELRAMVSHVLDDERQKIAEQAKQAQAEAIQLLEKKVSRLAGSLEETQKERDKHRRQLAAIEQSGGVSLSNIMAAGLGDDDPDKERKLALMKEIADQNREMRDHYKETHGELPKARIQKTVKLLTDEERGATDGGEGDAEQTEAAASSDDTASPSDSQPEETVAEPSESEAPVSSDSESEMADEDDGEPLVDPDDLPWTGPEETESEIADDSPIKKISASSSKAPPPMTVVRSKKDDDQDRTETEIADEAVADSADGDDLVDPDDLPWEPPADEEGDSDDDSPIKKISSTTSVEPPPLERKPKGDA